MRRLEFPPAARRPGHRIGLGAIAAVLSVVVALAAEHATQAQNAAGMSGLSPGDVEARNLGENSIGKISATGGSKGKGCEMSREEFAKFYPPLRDWIRTTLATTAHAAQTVASRGFSRLPFYFTEQTLASTKVVLVDPLPMPSLSSMGLARFAEFQRGNFDGVTYMDTFFLKPTQSNSENVHFHELVHVIQWRLLGPDRFLFSYANGLECFGYRQSPLEAMAYYAETAFTSSTAIFDVEKMVAEKLGM